MQNLWPQPDLHELENWGIYWIITELGDLFYVLLKKSFHL